MNFETITPAALDECMKRGDEVNLVDVREEVEYEIARIEGARLLPLSRFNEWASTLSPEDEFVFMCHHGIRSAQVCSFLARQGFKKLHNLAGGIDGWSREVDQRVARY
ncbi:MAG TPA: rhodanese-like domain-containing protein [Pyrinomonadaceae bacterium]|nr:rhodanese-like domain-containing protein [Pyrinomonadaceae bacterium]